MEEERERNQRMAMRAALKEAQKKQMILVYFEEDNSVSIVKETTLVEELSTLSKGSKCSVKERSKVYSGLVVDIGDVKYLEKLEESFLVDNHEVLVGGENKENEGKENAVKTASRKRSKLVKNKTPKWPCILKEKPKPANKHKPKGSIITVTDHNDKCENNDEQPNTPDITPAIIPRLNELPIMEDENVNEVHIADESEQDAISESDPLLLEVTLHELQFRLDEQEKLTLEAFKRIQELEKLLFQPLEPLQLSDINIGDVCDPPPLPETYNYEYNSTSPAIPQTTSTAIPQIHPNPNNYNNYQQEPHQLSETSLVPPQCQPIEGKRKSKGKSEPLPSSEIKKDKLVPADYVIQKYPDLRKNNVIGTLAVKLAKEAFFGEDILVRCTVMGCNSYPALPQQELNNLKQTVFSLF